MQTNQWKQAQGKGSQFPVRRKCWWCPWGADRDGGCRASSAPGHGVLSPFYSQLRSSPYCGCTIALLLDIVKVKVLVTESCLILCDRMDCGTQGSSVPGILQARIPEGLAIPFSGGSSPPRSNSGLRHCRRILHHLSHQGNPIRSSSLCHCKYPRSSKLEAVQYLMSFPDV